LNPTPSAPSRSGFKREQPTTRFVARRPSASAAAPNKSRDRGTPNQVPPREDPIESRWRLTLPPPEAPSAIGPPLPRRAVPPELETRGASSARGSEAPPARRTRAAGSARKAKRRTAPVVQSPAPSIDNRRGCKPKLPPRALRCARYVGRRCAEAGR